MLSHITELEERFTKNQRVMVADQDAVGLIRCWLNVQGKDDPAERLLALSKWKLDVLAHAKAHPEIYGSVTPFR